MRFASIINDLCESTAGATIEPYHERDNSDSNEMFWRKTNTLEEGQMSSWETCQTVQISRFFPCNFNANVIMLILSIVCRGSSQGFRAFGRNNGHVSAVPSLDQPMERDGYLALPLEQFVFWLKIPMYDAARHFLLLFNISIALQNFSPFLEYIVPDPEYQYIFPFT